MWKRRILQFLGILLLVSILLSEFGSNLNYQLNQTGPIKIIGVKKPMRTVLKPVRPAGKILPVENKIIVGVFEENVAEGRTKFEAQTGDDVAVVALYQGWGDQNNKFPLALIDGIFDQGKIPMITWEPWRFSKSDFDQKEYRLNTITAGQHDAYIREWLIAVRGYKGPIFVRFAHEMNGNWYPWGYHVNSPKEYVTAWRYIVDLSRELGADNITWVWSPNEVDSKNHRLDDLYPGNEYVDWIGVSGFNWSGLEPWQRWRSFSDIFDLAFNHLRKYDKPLMVAEIGVASNPRAGKQTKAAWITETLAAVKNNDPQIAMFVWFNDKYMSGGKLYDWRIGDSSDSIDAMKIGLDDPSFVKSLN